MEQNIKLKIDNDNSTKATIFKAAAKLFAEKGFNGVSMREISELSNVTKPTIYYYFGNKEGIYKALIQEALNYHLEDLKQIAALKIPMKQKLIELLKRRFQISLQYPELTKFVLQVFTHYEKLPCLDGFESEVAAHAKIFAEMIQQGIDSGEFGPSARPELVVHVIGAVLLHFLMNQLNSAEQILSDQLAEELIELLFKGLNE
ncbi:MAG: TetR/AcrR family transcriptional regulator [candidate division KSB1 bacterium]|nr:TetR/AcrR family transcriptional regulator [candidate division KSB1 bacterium]MDZ7335804.1 TetR/AcrR family transcriptional regulator [candidate division KSB1 bacterium]MDZ7358620.1 TetR/AcrR family transcriptional regulator [candidate division KSB1 bacterium]MDZ7375936.1 TetR/AcrR family transcriptional regulator [candidate division KSB1 bacterium]MDZ7402158.1 TetR/AcrR family transcriptional regulator [candidate division KSB1 bacterium]